MCECLDSALLPAWFFIMLHLLLHLTMTPISAGVILLRAFIDACSRCPRSWVTSQSGVLSVVFIYRHRIKRPYEPPIEQEAM